MAEINDAVKFISNYNEKIVIMHCNLKYQLVTMKQT